MLAVVGAVSMLAAGGCTRTEEPTPAGALDAIGVVTVDRALHDQLPQAIRARGSVRFVTDASYAPMEYFAADGRTIIGFEPDLAAALGEVLGVRAEMVVGPFSTALDEVVAGSYDGVLSSMTDTSARRKDADFVNYLSTGTSIVVQRGNPLGITDLADLCGRIVAAEKGTFQEQMLRDLQDGCGDRPIVIKSRPTSADAQLLLRTGRAVAVLVDFPPAVYLARDARTSAFYELASDEQYEPGLFGIAVAKENTALRDCLRAALQRLIESGTYAELLARWGLSSSGVPEATVNGRSTVA
jgi:polar amino acid transport system substrate-binding protein